MAYEDAMDYLKDQANAAEDDYHAQAESEQRGRDEIASLTAERDQLRAENERLRENGTGLYVSNTQLQARAEAAERECMEYIDYRNQAVISRNAMERERDEAQAHAADLRAALGHVQRNTHGHRDLSFADSCWQVATESIARTPAQSLGRVKAEALRSMARENITLTCRDLEAEADRLEATDAR